MRIIERSEDRQTSPSAMISTRRAALGSAQTSGLVQTPGPFSILVSTSLRIEFSGTRQTPIIRIREVQVFTQKVSTTFQTDLLPQLTQTSLPIWRSGRSSPTTF